MGDVINVQYHWVRVLNEHLENNHHQNCQCVQLIKSDFVTNQRFVRIISARNFNFNNSQQDPEPAQAQATSQAALKQVVQ